MHKLIVKYKKEMAMMIGKTREVKLRNTKDKVKVANKFLRGLNNEEMLRHFSRIVKQSPDAGMRDYVMDICKRSGWLDSLYQPTELAKGLGIFGKRKSRSEHKLSTELILTPFGQLALAVETVKIQEALDRLRDFHGLHV